MQVGGNAKAVSAYELLRKQDFKNSCGVRLAFFSTGLKISYKRILRGYSMESFVSSHFVLSRGPLRDADFC